MKVGYVVLYEDGELVISKNHILLQKKIKKDYGEFEDTAVPWKNKSSKIKKIHILNNVKSNCMKAWFENCMNLITLIDFENLDVSDCSDFSFMFYNCNLLQNLNGLQDLNVSNGTDFSNMFYDCKSLQNINGLQNWNVSNGTNFSYMFTFCKSLENLNELQNWNVSNGTNFLYMFTFCKSLENILLPNTLSILRKDIFFECNTTLKIHWKNHTYTYDDLLEYEKIC